MPPYASEWSVALVFLVVVLHVAAFNPGLRVLVDALRACPCRRAKRWDPQVAHHIEEQKQRAWRYLMMVCRHCCLAVLLARIWSSPFDVQTVGISIISYVAQVIYPTFFIWASSREPPSERRARLLQRLRGLSSSLFACCWTMVLAYAIVVLCMGASSMAGAAHVISLEIRVIATMIHGDALAAAIANGLCGAAIAVSYAPPDRVDVATAECASCVLVVAVAYLSGRMWHQAGLDAEGAVSKERAVLSLVNATCDAVINLDSDLVVRGSSPKLASLLLQTVRAPALDGVQLVNLLANDDGYKQAVVDHLSNFNHVVGASREECASQFALDMKDASDETVRTTVYHSLYRDASGDLVHVMGLTEKRESEERRVRSMTGPLNHVSASACSNEAATVARRPTDVSASSKDTDETECSEGSLMYPRFKKTQGFAREISLLRTVQRWNLQKRPGSCCAKHAVLEAGIRQARNLLTESCEAWSESLSEDSSNRFQCGYCGLLCDGGAAPARGRGREGRALCEICTVLVPFLPQPGAPESTTGTSTACSL